MNDLFPPDEPMRDQARARIRAELLETAQAAPPARRWLVPGSVAAAVVVVTGLAAWTVQPGGGPDTDPTPAAATSAVTKGGPAPSASPSTLPAKVSSSWFPDGGQGHQAGTGDCRQEMVNVLPGAERAASMDRTTFWVKGGRFVVCDTRAGTTTVHRALPLDPAGQASTYAVSSAYSSDASTVTRVAGGIVPAGATSFDVSYTFPDGGVEHAQTMRDDQGRTWWRMVHTSDDGGGNEMDQQPIGVTVSSSGAQRTYTLRWGLDTCAQANHGC